MNYFLILIIVGLSCCGYYGITANQREIASEQQQITDLQAKLDPLTAQSRQLAATTAQLTKGSTEAQTQIADLTQQIQTAQTAIAAARQAAAAPASAPPPPAAAEESAPTLNNLGTITTLDGKSYQNCTLLKVQPDRIVITNSSGITEVAYGLMPPDLQKRFGYDPHLAPALTDAQVETLEEKRKAAAGTGN